jgi:hypothetical protein
VDNICRVCGWGVAGCVVLLPLRIVVRVFLGDGVHSSAVSSSLRFFPKVAFFFAVDIACGFGRRRTIENEQVVVGPCGLPRQSLLEQFVKLRSFHRSSSHKTEARYGY